MLIIMKTVIIAVFLCCVSTIAHGRYLELYQDEPVLYKGSELHQQNSEVYRKCNELFQQYSVTQHQHLKHHRSKSKMYQKCMVLYQPSPEMYQQYLKLQHRKPATHQQGDTALMNDPGWAMHRSHSENRCNGVDNFCCTETTPCDVGEGDCDNDDQCARDLVCGDINCKWGDSDDCCMEKRRPAYPKCSTGRFMGGYGNGKHYRFMDMLGTTWGECIRACEKYKEFHPDIKSVTMVKKSWNKHGAAAGCWCNHHSEYRVGRPGTRPFRTYQTCFFNEIDTSGYRCQGANNNCCTEDNPCKENDGDCDYHSECEGDLVCGNDNCPWGKDDDCCVKPTRRYADA